MSISCRRPSLAFWLVFVMFGTLAASTTGCAGSGKGETTTPNRREVEFEELRINARAKQGGGYDFESYDAGDLFKRATELLNAQKCQESVTLYDRLVTEFEASEYVSASLYNSGLCLQALGNLEAAAERYTKVRTLRPQSEDVKDSSFLLTEVLIQLERWGEAQKIADELLAREDLSQEERLEGMARRAQALLGLAQLEEAERYAQSALSYFRTRAKDKPIRDEFFAAACNYVLAETFRLRGEALKFPEGLEEQKQILIRRAQLLLQAQREYFNTISFQNLDNLHWAAASGYRIGHMYDELWQSVMHAPVPANLRGAEAEKAYHDELAKLVKPLIRHAIRYWEMTLMFIERAGVKTTWSDKTKADLTRVRALLLEQPAGEGGLPQQQNASTTSTVPAAGTPAPAPAAAPASAPASQPTAAPAVAAPAVAPAVAPASGQDEGPPKEPTRQERGAAKPAEQ
jgi:tetratricopeptide (TPR) repeat protein